MNILFPTWKSFGVEDIKEAFEKYDHNVIIYNEEPTHYRLDPKYKSVLRKYITEHNIDAVFTSNYFPVISDACKIADIPYLAWCYDNPLVLTFSKTIFNSCNYFFMFDTDMTATLQNLGVKHAYYLPMAINASRLNSLKATSEQKKIVAADVSFVGSLYTEKHTLYDRLEDLDDYTLGYLEGIMNAQRQVYGVNFLEESLTPEIINKLLEKMPVEIKSGDLETFEYIYANYFLCRKITQTERSEFLQMIADALPSMSYNSDISAAAERMKLYTPEATPFLKNIKNMGTVHYMYEMPLVFRHTKINLNITLRSIKHGIPLRAMDIMGAGGFLLTNYQPDFNLHFVEGEDYASYSSPEELLYKIEYYLQHSDERKRIAENARIKVAKEHTYDIRIKEMLQIAGL